MVRKLTLGQDICSASKKSRGGSLAKPKRVSGVFAVREGYWLSTSKGGFESPIPRGQTAATVKATPSMILAGVMKGVVWFV